ncbi:Autotransporter adhesin [Xenorhabdus vietnamensis]|uniref:Autotransporter adhesin n=1 Tax=Xenorhabdus vietnamensis TaxID=351656 RepID=A0A1Y2SD35_9GAMM|nr:MARTX multifunctional-autoprocessing repeats-in-toxin holotoxin RtxA [Xenorhabdus vietnamensis]OTA16515.1 Autotransporter adhesin [Xenorhabdus vietnamensis]
MGKSSNRSTEYFFTGKYEDDDDGNTIHAIGVGGVINAYGGNDYIVVGSIGATVNTTWGHDTIVGAAGYLNVNDTGGDLTVKGGSGFTSINKTQSGPIRFEGISGGVKINHTGEKSGIFYSGAAGYNSITRKGLRGDISFDGAGAYNEIWHETNQGNFSYKGAGGGNKIDRTWFDRYQSSQGNITFSGVGAANIISSRVESGNIDFKGAGVANQIVRQGKIGNVTLQGAGASNIVERIRQTDDVYSETHGDIKFEGAGGYNRLHSDVAHGNIQFSGAGGYNHITRKGTDNGHNNEGMVYTKAEEIVLTRATMGGSWIGDSHQVMGLKSTRETNTYLFAFADGSHTKVNKVKLLNDPNTGKLRYYSTSWYKEGNHLKDIDKQDISDNGGFHGTNTDGAYTLSNLTVEHHQTVNIHSIQEKLTENEWVDYGNGVMINAADITLSDAKMGGYAIYRDGTTVDVKAVKSKRMPNTYVYGKQLGEYTKVVVVELRNDPKTGVLQYIARPLYKDGNHTANLANEDISTSNDYRYMGTGSYSLSDLHYNANIVHISSGRVPGLHEYNEQELFKTTTVSGESSGDIYFDGAGAGNVIESNVTRGNVIFKGAGIANVIEHSSEFGHTEFDGAGGANVIIKKGKEGNLKFNGAGIANVLLHQGLRGDMEVNAGGAANVLVRVGDGRYLAHLLAVGNISIHKGNGDSRIAMGGGFNTHTQIGNGDAFWSGVGGANVLTQMGQGNVSSILVGGANVLTKIGEGDLESAMFGGANIISHISDDTDASKADSSNTRSSNTSAIALGGTNVLTKKGKGDLLSVMGGGANVLTHVGDGKTTGVMLGGANILTKVGNGDTTGIMLGLGNILTHVGDGQTLGVMAAAGNIFTKVGEGTTIAAMVGAGNIFTHVGDGNAWALMGGAGNIFTKVGNGDALALMLAFGNVYTHIGDGMSVALMIAKGNIATKAGNGEALSAMIGEGNIFTQVGNGSTFAAMIGGANILTKVGDGLTAALMVGKANIYTHAGEGTSIGLFAGTANIMTKVGNGTTLAAMFGEANIMTHVGDGLTGVLALGKANIVTKVGNDFMGVVAASEANVVTHVGDGTTAALLAGKGNILTKSGDGTTVGLLISKIGNIMTHIGDGTTVGFAKGEANIITKVGDGLGINAAWGKANIMTHYGDGDRYNFAKGDANIVTKVGDGQEVTVVQGQANIVTHVGDGDDYTGAWGKANVITKVGNGRNVVLAKGEANIVTQVGDGDSFNALWSQGNVVTKVGDGIQVTAAKGKENITTTVGNGLSVTAVHGDLNINTKVGDGVSVNVAWGKLNVNTRVGDGLNVSVMKGKGNANIRVGDGLNVNASYARDNVVIQVGNGDFYSLAVAESNTQSNKLNALFDNIKQTVLGSTGSQGINYLVNGDEANTSGTHKGRGAIDLPEVSSLNGFKLTEIDEITSDLKNTLKGSVTGVDTPDMGSIENTLGNEKHLNPNQSRNLIVNGDFEQGSEGWTYTNGIEASHSAKAYGLSAEGHGERVSELDVQGNTHIYQDIQNLTAGEEITVKFDFARRAGSSADNGLEVWWNDEVVYAAANGKSEWQNKTLTLTAKAGKNKLGFSGIGSNDGLGYVLDNVSAISPFDMSGTAITEHMQQDKAAHNALQDKENAEVNRQRLAQERDKQQAAISGTQKQLENTDLDALNANGQTQRDAINDEARAVTEELMAKTKGLQALDSHATYNGQSGKQWREQFAGDLLESVQTRLDSAKKTAQQQLEHSQQASSERLGEVRNAAAKSESGVLKGEQNHQQSQQHIEKARSDIEFREKEALARMKQAEQAEHDGKSAVQKAEQRGQNDVSVAEVKTAKVQSDAKGAKLDDNYKPNRINAAHHGQSNHVSGSTNAEVHSANVFGEPNSSRESESTVATDGEFNVELQYLDEDLNELTNAKEALDRLQINAGVRSQKINNQNRHLENTGTSLTPVHAEISDDNSVNNTDSNIVSAPAELVRNTPKISGLDLSGLKALGETEVQQESVNAAETESTATIRAQKVAEIYRWLDSDNNVATENHIPVPGFEQVDADIPDNLRQKMVTFVEGYLNGAENSVPKDQISSLAKLFVDATIDYDWDKRVEFVSRLESYGYSFKPVHGDKSIVSFWSGRNFEQYRDVLDAAQTDGKKVVYDIDVKGNSFAIALNKTLMRWGGIYLDSDVAEQKALQSAINASAYSNTGFWSSLYATGSRGDVYVIAEGGLRFGNYFWNVELPVLRQLQREGLVGEIRLLDKTAKEYQGVALKSIGRRLTEAGVSVKARFDSLSFAEQERLLALDPDKYRPDTLVDLNVKTSAIDSLLNQALPFYGLRTERNLLVRESDDRSFEVRPWPGNNSDVSKIIIVEDPDDLAQIKSVERFILANYENYDQLPESLYLSEDRIISLDHGRTRIIAKKVEGSWNYKPKTDLMSVSELQEAAYVKGKIRGDSYRNVLEALKSYENTLQNSEDYDLEAVEKLTHLRDQVNGYLLGHPNSERIPALKNLLSQINVRMEESLVLAEPTVNAGKNSFSELYNKLGNANLKDTKHLYIDGQGDFVTRGKSNIQIATKLESAEKAVEQVKAAVTKEYGQSVSDSVFSNLTALELSKDGKGIDVSGLRKVHQAIEQQLSPVSATLFVWKPSDHSRLGHAALQIGQGRVQISAENAGEFNEKNYVSWWPKGSKSSDLGHIFNIASEEYPDLRIRWSDLSQPAAQNETLEQDVASEEGDHFGLHDGTRKLEKFIEKIEIAKGVDAKFEDISEGFAMAALANPHLLESAGIPEAISRPFMKQWEDGSIDMLEVGKNFAEALRKAAKQTPELTEKRIAHVIRKFAKHELSNIQDFKASEGDQGRVFRINLAGLDAAAMQVEWQKINQNPDARYQLLTDNCSSIVARVLKAGGADKVIGHTWRPKFGVWTPTELFNFAQALQEAQVEANLHKPNRVVSEDLEALGHSDKKDKVLEKIAIDNDGTPPRDREPFNPVTRFLNDELYGSRENRRNIDDGTQIILDAAVADGAVDKVTLRGEAGRLTGYYHTGSYHNADQKDQAEQGQAQEPTKKVVLFIHGSGSSAEEQASTIQSHYQKQGVDMLAVNMRGYGSSDGHPSEKGLYQDARTMFNYLVNDRGIKPENIIIHGYSMGGAVAADLARYAERKGQAVSGLLLDRPMPSMTKAITAHEVPNPAGITGVLAKAVNGQFSVEKNLQGISKQTPIMLLTDNEGLGKEGEKLRAKLVVAGYQVSGEQTFYGHEASSRLMNQYADQIVSALSGPRSENGGVKAGLLEKMFYTLFDVKSGGKELDKYSFHFTQGESLLQNLEKLVPEIGNVLLTNGNHVESKEFLEGVCFALSARYLIEERVHGLGGGKEYLSWLTDAVKAYNDNSLNKKSDINSIESSLLNQYRRQHIGPAIQDLLSMQYSQTQNMSNSVGRDKANKAYGGKLKANGLTGDRIDRSLSNDIAGYESVMEQLRDVDKTTYMSFMSEDHAMAVVVHKGENQTVWSFYDPNFGIKSFDNYKDFEHFMDSFHKGMITGYQSKFGYKYEASMEANQSFYVNYNTFEDSAITHYDGVWQQARAGEQQYVLRALKEQGKTLKLGSNVTGRVVDYSDNAVTLEVTTKKGEKVLVEVESNNFKQAANLVQSNINKVVADSKNGKFTLRASAENNGAVSALDNLLSDNTIKKTDAGQTATDSFDVKSQPNEAEVLKGIESDLKRYGKMLEPQADSPGKKPKDIRTTEDFLTGYKQGYAEQVVDGFRPSMDIKQLVDLLAKGSWSAEQKGALAWEIESRALKITFQPKAEKFNRLFRDVASTGVSDTKASEQLAPQLLLLNLSNDGFGGRCDPLSKLVLVAKQLENDGQDGVARQLLEKMYSAAAVLNNPDLYSETEHANANKLLGSLAALHAKNPMADTFIKVWKEKLEDAKALTVDGVIQKVTAGNTEGKPVLLELDGPDHAMAAWAKGNGENRVYGFYDPNAGIVEFSSAEKFGAYVTRFFGESDLNMAQHYKLPKNAAGESVFGRVVVIDGDILATYRPRLADKITMRGMLDLPVFDDTPIKKPVEPVEIDVTDVVKKPLGEPSGDNLPESHIRVNNHDVDSWVSVDVKQQPENSDSRFNGQIIIQTENDPVAAKAAASLASKHPDSSVIVQLDAAGKHRVVYGDPAALFGDQSQSGKLRWQIVGHGREESAQNHTRMSGYSARELALRLKQFSTDFKQAGIPDHISLVGCSLISDDNRNGFAHSFISELDKQGIRASVSARSSEVAVDSVGRKYTKDAREQWVHKFTDNKIVLGWNDKGEVESHSERIRRGISEKDINLSLVGQKAVADNAETSHAPKPDHEKNNHAKHENKPVVPAESSNKQLSYSGNIQVQAGHGEFTVVNWGTTNVGIKIGTGGFKSLAFGDNNVMVHIGDGDSKHSVDIAGYQALEGAQLFVGNRNISFNAGRSNDLLVMLEKSIPTPPLVNPFGGAARISGVLQNIAGSFDSQDWLTKQDQQWTLESAKKYVSDLSGIDLTSSVDYNSLTNLDSQNERSSRGLKSDLESTLNKKYNQWLGRNGNTPEMGKTSRADKFRHANEKLAFNFAVGGQGADIQVTTGNWNFMFGDNIQSILDTNLGSLFSLMTQEYTDTGMAKTTFTFSPTDLPRQIKNKLLGKLAGVGEDTTLADIFGVDYTPQGGIVSRSGQSVDGVAILSEMLEIIGEFSGDQLKAFTDPKKLLDGLKASLNIGKDGVKSFAESHGLKAKAPDENQKEHVTITKEDEPAQEGKPATETADSQADRDFGLTSLNLPNLFATLFNRDKQAEMESLVTNLKENLTADLLNMKDKTFDFLRNSGHLQGDGDIHVSLGNYNFNWGGDGKDLGAYLGDNNNFWGGRGDDVFYSVGTSNIFSGGEGKDVGVMMGRENMMFGGAGNDVGVLAGRINYAYMGDGDDQVFAFGEGGVINGGKGRDYIVAAGNFNRIDAGEDQDYVVTIGNNNQVDLGKGNDFATVFGNYNQIDGSAGNNSIKLMGYHAVINGGTGDDHLIADVVSKFSQINGGDGDDLLILGGYQNRFKGGTGVNSFVVSGDAIDNVVEDIKQGDKIVFNDINWKNLWFQRSGYDLVLLTHRNIKDTSAQGQFEAMGSVTFNNYFNGNRADIITQRGAKDTQGEREYTALSANAVDSLVQAMSGFAPNMGDSGFIDSLDSQTKSAIVTAWSDTTKGKSKLV